MQTRTRSENIAASAGRPPAPRGRRPAGVARWRRRYRWITIAAGVVIVVLTYFPLVFVLSNSLKSGQEIYGGSGVFSLFTQFEAHNYALAWTGVSHQLLNTVIVAVLAIVIGVTAAALGAYTFSQLRFRGKELLFLAYVALLFVPTTLTLIPLFLTIQKLHFFNTWWGLVLPYAASAATSSAFPPTARSGTSASAGSATRRSSRAPPLTTGTSPRSSPSGWTTWPTPSSRPAPSPTSRRGSISPAPGRLPGATRA